MKSLQIQDIQGAQSRLLHRKLNRQLPEPIVQASQEILMQGPKRVNYSIPTRYNEGRRKYQNDLMNIPNQIIPQGDDFFQKGGKRHYLGEYGEIRLYDTNQNSQEQTNLNLNFDRALDTQDIEGAKPGTLMSRVVKNKQLAQKYKLIEEQLKSENIHYEEKNYKRYANISQKLSNHIDQQQLKTSLNIQSQSLEQNKNQQNQSSSDRDYQIIQDQQNQNIQPSYEELKYWNEIYKQQLMEQKAQSQMEQQIKQQQNQQQQLQNQTEQMDGDKYLIKNKLGQNYSIQQNFQNANEKSSKSNSYKNIQEKSLNSNYNNPLYVDIINNNLKQRSPDYFRPRY